MIPLTGITACQFAQYKCLASISGDPSSHLLECLSADIHKLMFDTYGQSITGRTEATLMKNIKRMVVTERYSMKFVMALMMMSQVDGKLV